MQSDDSSNFFFQQIKAIERYMRRLEFHISQVINSPIIFPLHLSAFNVVKKPLATISLSTPEGLPCLSFS